MSRRIVKNMFIISAAAADDWQIRCRASRRVDDPADIGRISLEHLVHDEVYELQIGDGLTAYG